MAEVALGYSPRKFLRIANVSPPASPSPRRSHASSVSSTCLAIPSLSFSLFLRRLLCSPPRPDRFVSSDDATALFRRGYGNFIYARYSRQHLGNGDRFSVSLEITQFLWPTYFAFASRSPLTFSRCSTSVFLLPQDPETDL